MFRVPGHDVKAMASRSSSDQSVACRNDLTGFLRDGCEFSPSVACFEISGKNSIRVIAFERLQPCLEFAFVLAFLKKCYPFGDVSDRYDTDKQAIAFKGFNHTADTGMSFGAAQFGKHAGIEKNSQSFASRMGESSRVRFSLSKLAPPPIRNSLKSGRFPVSFS